MTGAALGILLGLIIGMGCRWFDIPLPAPPTLTGALLVVAMTAGFLSTDFFLTVDDQPTASDASQGDEHEQHQT